MLDILKKRKSKRTVCSNSDEMLFKKEKSKSLLSFLPGMFKKKKKKDRIKEASDDMSRRKPNGDSTMLTSLERSDSGMRCSLTTVCDSLQAAENLDSMGVTAETVRKKQHEQSCADNGRVKELEDCGRTMMFTNDLQKHVHVIIDYGSCKITLYSDVSSETEVRARIVETNNETFSMMIKCSNFQPETCDAEKKKKDMPKTFKLDICRAETDHDENEISNPKKTALMPPTSEAEKKRKDMPKTFKSNICRLEMGQKEDEICNRKRTALTPPTIEAKKKRKDMPNIFQSNICRLETGHDEDEICNRKPTAIVLPTRCQANRILLRYPYFVERNTVELAQRNVTNADDNAVVKTDEDGHGRTVNSSSNMEPDNDNTFVKDIDDCNFYTSYGSSNIGHEPEYQSDDTVCKDLSLSSSISSRPFENNGMTVMSLQERDKTSENLNNSYFDSIVSAEQETVQNTEVVRTYSINGNYSEDQKSRNENQNDAVAEMQTFVQTDAKHQDIQDSHPVHNDNIQYPQECGHSTYFVSVGTPEEEKNTSSDQEMKCSSIYDLSESCITHMTLAKLVEKVDHLESLIGRLYKLDLFAVRSNSRIPDIMKKEDQAISDCQGNCKSYLNDDDIIRLVKGTSLPCNSFNYPECQEQTEPKRSTSLCSIYTTLDLESLKHTRVGKVSPATSVYIHAAKMNHIWSDNTSGKKAKKIKMQKMPKALEIGKPVTQPIGMLMLERSLWDTGAESNEIGHTLSFQRNQIGGNGQQKLNFKQNLKSEAKRSPLVVELNKSSRGETYCNFSEDITVDMDDAMTHVPDSLQSKEKDLNNNEAKSSCLSDAILTWPVTIGHTNRSPMENIENDAQVELAASSRTTESIGVLGSSVYGGKDYTITRSIPMMDSKLTFINNDPNILCGRESVEDQIIWNNLNIRRNKNAESTNKLTLEAADSTDNSKETDCCPNANADDVSCLHLIDSNIDQIITNPFKIFPRMESVISDPECILGHGIPPQHEECQQREDLVCYYHDHSLQVQHSSKEKITGESQSIQDSESEKPGADEFVSVSKLQEEKFKEPKSVLNKKKPLKRSKSGVRYRLCSLQRKRKSKKGKVKLKKSIKFARKVSHAEKVPGILSNLKILLRYLTLSVAQDTALCGTFTQTIKMQQEKHDFATELGIVVSEKENSTQERLIDDFLRSLVSPWFIFPTISSGLQRVILLPTGLQLYFERLMRGAPPEERERMSYEWLRLQTFINYPSSAPSSGIRLSRAGFYYNGNGTETMCYACGVQHSGWNFHDDPYEIHRRISPHCPFLRGNPTYPNVPIMQEGEQNGIQMGSNTSGTPISQTRNLTMVNQLSDSNGSSEMSAQSAIGSQNSTITEVQVQSSDVASLSIQNPQERGLEQQASQQSMSEDEQSLGIDQHVALTEAALDPNTGGESQQQQSRTTENITLSQQYLVAENTQCKSAEVIGLVEPIGQVEDPGVDPTPQTMSERPKHPEYAPLSSRVHSYTGWPIRLDQTPQQMAEAGFYYAGVNDYTRCFQCGGGLRNWEPGENPWIEHARWYPQCAYVLSKRGQRFVNAVLKKQAELLEAHNAQRNNNNFTTTTVTTTTSGTTTTTVTTTTYGTITTTVTTTTSGTNTTTVTNMAVGTTTTSMSSGAISKTCNEPVLEPATLYGQPRNPIENEISNRLINEMGYQQERVREAILEVKRRRGQQVIAFEHVLEVLIADEERKARADRQNADTTVTAEALIQESGRLTLRDTNPPHAISTPTPPSEIPPTGPMNVAADVLSSSATFSNQKELEKNNSEVSNRPRSPPLLESTRPIFIDADSLREEYMRLKNQNLCKICMERNVELVFLPCGHLVFCEVCGQTLRFCPICRAKIQASVRAFLS